MGISNIGTNSSYENYQTANSPVRNGLGNNSGKDGEKITLSVKPSELGYKQTNAPKETRLTDQQIEEKVLKHFGLNNEQAKLRLNTDNPFKYLNTTGDNTATYNAKTGNFEIKVNIEKDLYKKLNGTAKRIKKEIAGENKQSNRTTPGENNAARAGIDNTSKSKAELNRKLDQTINLNELAKKAQVLNLTEFGIPTDPNELKTFYVNLPNIPNMSDEGKALRTLIGNNYGHLNISYQNEIASLAKDAGVKVQNLQTVGGNLVKFDLSVADVLKLKIAAISVQEKANSVEKIYRETMDENHFSMFAKGVATGAFNSVSGTVGLVVDLPGTMKALWQVLSSPVETFKALSGELEKTWDEFKTAPSEKKAEMIGELVGSAIVEILIGKGIGKAGSILAKTKAGAELLERAKIIKAATATKIAEKFTDEAAQLASQRVRQRLATQLYAGIPADILADMAVIAGNKVKNGAVKFADFSKQMVDEFGDKVKPKLLELYQDSFEKVFGTRKTLTLDELLGGHSIEKHVGKSENWLRKRLVDDSTLKIASSFRDYKVANRTISNAIKENSSRIEKWLEGSETKLVFKTEMQESIGIVLERGKGGSVGLKTAKETNKAEVILVKDNTPQGWHVLTSYPTK